MNDERISSDNNQARQADNRSGEPMPISTRIGWDIGTAYDLFFSR
jgi:hypothetical protein